MKQLSKWRPGVLLFRARSWFRNSKAPLLQAANIHLYSNPLKNSSPLCHFHMLGITFHRLYYLNFYTNFLRGKYSIECLREFLIFWGKNLKARPSLYFPLTAKCYLITFILKLNFHETTLFFQRSGVRPLNRVLQF